ncbi:MAG: class I SAM-dependent methyltransferase [Polyangiaceae bacterium]
MASSSPISDACPLCASTNPELLYDLGPARGPHDVQGRIARCRECAMCFKLIERPEKIAEAYQGDYGQDESGNEYFAGDRTRRLFRDVLSPLTSRAPGGRLLDIGAGYGTLVEEAGKLGFVAEGIDLSEGNVERAKARGLNVTKVAAEDLETEGVFDVVTMMDIIEHVPDPVAMLRAAHRALRPGGTAVIYTPNHSSAIVGVASVMHKLGARGPIYEIFGQNHVCFFDHRSLPLAATKAGFEVGKQRVLSYDPRRPGQRVSAVNLLALTLIEAVAWPVNRGFRLLTYATRPS